MSHHRVTFVHLACVGFAALHGCVGRPVIGERDPDKNVQSGACEDDGLNCDDWGAPEKFPEIDQDAFRVETFVADAGCTGETQELRLSGTQTVADLAVSCGTLRLVVANDADVALLQPVLRRARVEIASEGSARVTIDAARGDHVSIALEGASTLRLRTLDGVEDLRIDAAAKGIGWDVEIEDSSLPRLHVRTSSDAALLLRRTRVEDARVSAGRLSLQGATLIDPVLDVKELIAAGTDVNEGYLRARRGSFLNGTFTDVSLQGCESFLIADTAIKHSDVGACAAGPMELRNTTVEQSIVRGRVFALLSRMSECILGAEDRASLSLFDSTIVWSLLCEVESLSARGGSVLFCARCEPASPRAACIDEASAVAVVHCPEVAAASACNEPLPDSPRQPTADAGTADAAAAP